MSTPTSQDICTPDGFAGASGFYCLTRGQTVGLTIVAMSGSVSLTAVLIVFALILRNVMRARKLPDQPRLITVPMDLFMLSLFTADLFQSLGVVLDVKWINDGTVRVGHLCTAQGAMQHLGEAAVAMTTLIITLYTFASLWWGKGVSLAAASILVGVQWLFLILFVTISASIHNEFYTPTPYWCWIGSSFPNYRTAGENFWLWLAFAVSVLYAPLIMWNQGHVTPSRDAWWRFRMHSRREMGQKRISISLIVCALAYCIPVLPTSLARWFLAAHSDVKPPANSEAQFSVRAIFSLSGICDVLVFLLTRQGLLLFGRPHPVDPHPSQTSSIPGTPLVDLGDGDEHGYESHDTMPNPATNEHSPKMSSRTRVGVLISLWLIINALDAVWICYCVRSATDPNPRTAVNMVHAGWVGYFVMMYLFGFILGCVNIVVSSTYFLAASEWFSKKRGTMMLEPPHAADKIIKSRVFGVSWHLIHIMIIPVVVIICLGPFFAPYAGVKIAQKQAWKRRCDQFPGEVILDGRAYGSPADAMPRASFYFGQNGLRTKYYEYSMTMDETDANVWHFRFSQVEPGVTVPAQVYPLVQDISYQFANQTISANCITSPDAPTNATTPCMQGSFVENGYLSFSINDTRTNTVTKLRAQDKNWVYVPATDAPSFILKVVEPDNSLGEIALRTAVTDPGHCTSLKLCLETGANVLAPVGLTLLRQDGYARVCTVPNSN